MEINRRTKRSSSGDKFSFPVINDEFEFGSITSPASPNSPADRLFSNGKLLPHAFPIQTPNSFSYSRSTSRASSIGSKDSLISSRSNSTNSRSSTSTSEASERRRERTVRPAAMSCQYQYGASRRWQLIAAAPVLKHQGSRSRRTETVVDRKASKKSRGADEGSKSWFKSKFLKSFVSACQECHAIKT